MTKAPSPAFQPAPRPRPRVSPEQAQTLAAETGDLGFTRASSAPAQEPKPSQAPERQSPSTPEPENPPAQEGKAPLAQFKPATLKFEVPENVWTALRLAAIERRVTVKYLVLEALAAKGYSVDLSAIPEDGRRLR